MTRTPEFKRAYVWELPVRFTHWINVVAIFVLIVTGVIIGDPPAIMSGREASFSYWFGTVRLIHFVSAYVFTLNLLIRLYWAFVGNRFSSWRVFFPFSSIDVKKALHVFKVDIFLRNDKEMNITNIAVGHNPVAAFSYLVLFLLCAIQILTGFALYSSTATWFFPKMFGWVIGVFGDEFAVRSIHHAVTWIIIFFSMIHVYLVFYHDWLEGRGEVSSMFSGYKFVRKERLKAMLEGEEAGETEPEEAEMFEVKEEELQVDD